MTQPTQAEKTRRIESQKAQISRDYWNDRWMNAGRENRTQSETDEARAEFYKWDAICLQYIEAAL